MSQIATNGADLWPRSIVLLVLRRSQPGLRRPFWVPAASLIAPVAFICSNWIIYWTGFKTNSFLFGLAAAGFVIYAIYYHAIARKPAAEFGWRSIAWLLPWFGSMWVLSLLGGIGGGLGWLGFWRAVACVAVWSLVVIALAMRSALPAEDTAQMMLRMERMS